MSKADENEVLRHLKLLSQIEPTSEATHRAVEGVRDTLARKQIERESVATRVRRAITSRSFVKFAAAAILLMGAGFLVGHLSAPQQMDVEQLRADLVQQMNRRWESILETRHAQLREEVYRQVRRDLTEFAAQTLAASKDVTDQRLVELIRLIEAARLQDRQQVAAALDRIEFNRLRDKTHLGNALETLVAHTSEVQPTIPN
jgi:hypothetical protein